jgi:hypothetical protein
MLVLLMGRIDEVFLEMASGGMIYIASFKKLGGAFKQHQGFASPM